MAHVYGSEMRPGPSLATRPVLSSASSSGYQPSRLAASTRQTVDTREKDTTACARLFVEAMRTCAVLRIANMSGDENPAWIAALTRRAKEACAKAEYATIRRAELTWTELLQHCRAHQWDCTKLPPFHIELCLHEAAFPDRALTALKWMAQNLKLPLNLKQVLPPKTRKKQTPFGIRGEASSVLRA